MRAISDLRPEVGISARSCSARFALRILVSMSAIGSVCTLASLPARLGHARDDALVGELPQADSTETELPVGRAGAAAAVAALVRARLVALRLLGLLDQRLTRPLMRLSFVGLSLGLGPGERHPERAQEREPLLVVLGRGGDRHVQA